MKNNSIICKNKEEGSSEGERSNEKSECKSYLFRSNQPYLCVGNRAKTQFQQRQSIVGPSKESFEMEISEETVSSYGESAKKMFLQKYFS